MINLKELSQLKQGLSNQQYGDNEQVSLFSTDNNQLSELEQKERQQKKFH